MMSRNAWLAISAVRIIFALAVVVMIGWLSDRFGLRGVTGWMVNTAVVVVAITVINAFPKSYAEYCKNKTLHPE